MSQHAEKPHLLEKRLDAAFDSAIFLQCAHLVFKAVDKLLVPLIAARRISAAPYRRIDAGIHQQVDGFHNNAVQYIGVCIGADRADFLFKPGKLQNELHPICYSVHHTV